MERFGLYEVAAQVIPTLLVVLAVETRAFAPSPQSLGVTVMVRVDSLPLSWPRLVLRVVSGLLNVAVLALIVFSEILAFFVIADGSPAAWKEAVVLSAIVVELLSISFLAIASRPRGTSQTPSSSDSEPPGVEVEASDRR